MASSRPRSLKANKPPRPSLSAIEVDPAWLEPPAGAPKAQPTAKTHVVPPPIPVEALPRTTIPVQEEWLEYGDEEAGNVRIVQVPPFPAAKNATPPRPKSSKATGPQAPKAPKKR